MSQTAKVSELKAKLSGYLAQVRHGATITVCDRKTPIARLVPIDDGDSGLEVREAANPGALPIAPVVALRRDVDLAAWLREDRDER